MLKKADSSDFPIIKNFLGKGIIPVRLLSYMSAYGFDKDFVSFWVSDTESGADCVIGLFEDALLVFADEKTDANEIRTFISMLPYKTLSCEEETAIRLGFTHYNIKQGYVYKGERTEFTAEEITEEYIKSAYDLISDSIPGSFNKDKESYLAFLSDYTYRNRRNLARGKCITEEGRLVSCAFTSAESESEALLSGVATDEAHRKGGFGKRTVLSLVNALISEEKTSYVIALNDSAQGFYEHIGFEKDKKIAYINRKEQ